MEIIFDIKVFIGIVAFLALLIIGIININENKIILGGLSIFIAIFIPLIPFIKKKVENYILE